MLENLWDKLVESRHKGTGLFSTKTNQAIKDFLGTFGMGLEDVYDERGHIPVLGKYIDENYPRVEERLANRNRMIVYGIVGYYLYKEVL